MGGRPAHLKGLDCGLILVKFEGFFEKKLRGELDCGLIVLKFEGFLQKNRARRSGL
jgi:hypothetical protein